MSKEGLWVVGVAFASVVVCLAALTDGSKLVEVIRMVLQFLEQQISKIIVLVVLFGFFELLKSVV